MVVVRDFDEYMSVRDLLPPRENFAILFEFYLNRGPEFRRRMRNDVKLRKTYRLMKKEAFYGKEYQEMGEDESNEELRKLSERWDKDTGGNLKFRETLENLIDKRKKYLKKAESHKNN